MAQTRVKPRKGKATANGVVPRSGEVLTLPEAAAYLRVSESELIRLVHDQRLPGRPLGAEWRFLKSALQDWLKTPPTTGSWDAVLSSVGSMRNDLHIEDEIKETYRKRRENLVEDMP